MEQSNGEHTSSLEGLSRRRFLQAGAGFAVGGLVAAACGSSGSKLSAPGTGKGSGSREAKPRYGGRLRIGTAFGGPTDTLDPGKAVSDADFYRAGALFDALCYFDPHFNVVNALAESMEPDSTATMWTVRLRPGVKWQDGKPFTSADVVYTLKRNAKLQLVGTVATGFIDFKNLKAVDELTVLIPLNLPQAQFNQYLTAPLYIVQDGATDFSHPIGTGAFEFVSWTPGQTSLFKKNPDYFVHGQPYVDELQITTISDATARLNAVLSGQIDAGDQLTYEAAKQYKGSSSVQIVVSPPGSFIPFTMACDTPPFDDVRVRQAFRLIANRPELLDVAQLSFGGIGNDLAGKGLADYDTELPQRVQDIDRAKSLLKAAGKEGLTVTLNTSTVSPGMLEAATAFAQQAKAADVQVVLNNIPAADFYGSNYLKYTFGMSGWTALPVEGFMAGALAAGAPFNETHWHNTAFNNLYLAACAALDPARRQTLLDEAQKMLWDEGGYIIWGFTPYLDAMRPNVHYPPPTPANDLCGGLFREFWLG
jgi:peptide/nickel transport system substrate-binding protein